MPCSRPLRFEPFLCRRTTNGSNTSAANTNRSAMKLNTGKAGDRVLDHDEGRAPDGGDAEQRGVGEELAPAGRVEIVMRDDAASSPFAASSRSLAVMPSPSGAVGRNFFDQCACFLSVARLIPQPSPLRPQPRCERARGVARLRAACCAREAEPDSPTPLPFQLTPCAPSSPAYRP